MASTTKNNDENQHSVESTRKSVRPSLSDVTNSQETHGERDHGSYQTEGAPALKKIRTQHQIMITYPQRRNHKRRQKRSPSASSESSECEAPSSRAGSSDAMQTSPPGSPDTENWSSDSSEHERSSIPGSLRPTTCEAEALNNSNSAMEDSPTVSGINPIFHPSPGDSPPRAQFSTAIDSLYDDRDVPTLQPSLKHFTGRAGPI